jgi:NAD(P)-dependent dehydrogenase (short-subunit alcohol dehydrogenase family)
MSTNRKIALVTGGSRGLGREMVKSLAQKGLDIVLTYHQNEAEANNAIHEVEAAGGKAIAIQLDTANTKGFENFKTKLTQQLKAVFNTETFDFLINNAGIGIMAPFAMVTEEDFDHLVNIHFKGVFFLTQQLLPLINTGGGIINISSGLTRFTAPALIAYSSMKGAIEVFTRHLAKELGPKGIRVNTVAPGAIATDFAGGVTKTYADHMKSITALGRVGMADDIGGVIAFLCTDDAKWVTAQRLEASGGQNI